jgi:hypothetical protein
MLKKHMAACLVASAFITMPVLAQTSTSPGTASPGAGQPATGASSGGGGSGASATGGASGRFVTQQQQNQWRASRLIGINVYGANNERIGDINEVLVDRQGNADAVVVGVGGFLGIGEKNVALPFNAFEWQMDDTRRTAATSGTAGSGTAGSGTAGSGTAGSSTAGSGTAGTSASGPSAGAGAGAGPASGSASTAGTGGTAAGTTASTSAAGGSGSASGGSAARSGSGAERGYPDHAVLRMSKADLENAPTFRYLGDRSESGSGAGGGASRSSGTGTGSPGTAPRQ